MLHQNINIEKVLKSHLGDYYITGQERLFYCPFCHHRKKKLSINVNTGMWKCWICNKSGRNVSYLLRCLGIKVDGFQDINPAKEAENELFFLSLPEDFAPICEMNKSSFYFQKAQNYLSNRDITIDDAIKYKIGISFSGSFNNRLIFPSFNKEGQLNFYTGRTIDNHYIKYFVPKTPKNYKNTIIMNELNIDWTNPVLIVEGFIDMIKTGMDNVVPLFGSTLNKRSKLFAEICKNNTNVYICLDKDATKKQIDIAEDLLRGGIKVYIVDIGTYSDIGEMGKGVFLDYFNKAKQVEERDLILMKIKEKMK